MNKDEKIRPTGKKVKTTRRKLSLLTSQHQVFLAEKIKLDLLGDI